MANLSIPKQFQLLGHVYTVSEDPGAYYKKGQYGSCSFEEKKIRITPRDDNHPVSVSSMEHTFLHELIHACLYHTHRNNLNKDEEFVDLLAGLLHQALTTAEY